MNEKLEEKVVDCFICPKSQKVYASGQDGTYICPDCGEALVPYTPEQSKEI